MVLRSRAASHLTWLLFLGLLLSGLFAQDLIIDGAQLNGDVYWKGKVLIRGDVIVAKGARLIIQG